MKEVTHAYVGYRSDGTPCMLFVDDASKDCARACADVIADGGRIERVTLDEARKVQLYRSPAP